MKKFLLSLLAIAFTALAQAQGPLRITQVTYDPAPRCESTETLITVTVEGGTAPYSFGANPIPIDQTVQGNQATFLFGVFDGTSTITVKDSSNPAQEVSVDVVLNPQPFTSATFTLVHPTCNGFTNGSVTVAVTGFEASEFQLAPSKPFGPILFGTAGSSFTFEGLGAGCFCFAEASRPFCAPCKGFNSSIAIGNFCLIEPTPLEIVDAKVCAAKCPKRNDGSICNVDVRGGTAPYTYSVNGSAFVPLTQAFKCLTPGTYTIVAKDANGCLSEPREVEVGVFKKKKKCQKRCKTVTFVVAAADKEQVVEAIAKEASEATPAVEDGSIESAPVVTEEVAPVVVESEVVVEEGGFFNTLHYYLIGWYTSY